MVSTQGGVQLWDLDRQVQLASSPLVVSDAIVTHAAMSSDGTHVGATLQGRTVRPRSRSGTSPTEPRTGIELAPDVFVDVSFTNDGLYFGTLDNAGGSAAYRVSDGAQVAELTPVVDVNTDADRRSARRDGARRRPLLHLRQRQRDRVGLERGNESQVLTTYPLVLGGSPSTITGSGNAFVASDVAGTMTWVPFGLSSSASLAVPVGKVPAGSRFGISAAPNLLLAGVGKEFAVWDTHAQHAVGSFTASRADQAVPIFTALDRTARRVALGYADGTVELRDAGTGEGHGRQASPRHRQRAGFIRGRRGRRQYRPTVEPAELLVVSPDGSVRRLWRAPAHRRISAFATSG